MTPRIPPPACTHRVVLILAIVCLLATFTGVIFVGAHNDDNNLPPADQLTTSLSILQEMEKEPSSLVQRQ